MTGRLVTTALVAAIALGIGSTARADSILTLENPGAISYQQTSNRPCIIADPSCNSTGWDFTPIPNSFAWNEPLLSPTYTIGAIRTKVGNNFIVGIDVNTAGAEKTPNGLLADEILQFFYMKVNGSQEFHYTGPTRLYIPHNGNGYSDDLLTGFDISGFNATDEVTFGAFVTNATDGREQFFLINPGVPDVPEPATMLLLGSGLMGAGFFARKRRK